jgi:hypothetical protein
MVPSDRRGIRILILLALLVFLISIYVGGRSVFFQRTYDGKGAANLGALTDIHFLYLILLPAMLVSLCTEYVRRVRVVIFVCILMLVGLYLIYAFRWDHTNISYGYFSYAYRTLCCFLLLGVLSLATAIRFWPHVCKIESTKSTVDVYLALGVTAFFTSMALLMLYHTHGYYRWAQRFEQEAVSLKMHTPIDRTGINTNHGWTHGYNWPWGNPSTSIVLRGNAEAMVLNHSKQLGMVPGAYENVRLGADGLPLEAPQFEIYPFRPFIKKGLLFKDIF